MLFNQTAADRKVRVFSLSPDFLEKFKGKQPEWGAVGYFTFKRTYARLVDPDDPDSRTEEFWETLKRVVEGCYNIQKIHCRQYSLPWQEQKAQKSAQEMFEKMWAFKFLPPGRGLWMMGTDVVYDRGAASLQNCAFVSSEGISEDFADPFCFLMDMSMLGVGTGADTKGEGRVKIQKPRTTEEPHIVEDSREGWVELIRVVLNSFVGKGHFPLYIDYTKVRGRGVPLKTFGGKASGPKPLQDMVENLTQLLLPKEVKATFEVPYDHTTGKIEVVETAFEGEGDPYRIPSSHIVDIFNFIGKGVVAGGIRRTAEIMFGEPDDEEFLKLKQDKEALEDRRWASNNSVFAYRGMDYSAVAERIADNGEPGVFWLENAQQFSRMDGVPDNRDWRAAGLNPCFSGDTLIAVADGRDAVPIKQLAEEGFDVPVYSVDKKTGMVEIKWGRNPRKTRKQAELVEIEFECGNTLRVTPDHKMLLLDGTEIKAAELQKGDSLPRLTKRQEKIKSGSPHLYWRINCNTRDGRDSRVFEHRLIARFHNEDKWDALYQSGKKTGWKTGGVVVHHKNFDSLDNHPDNLEIMTFKDHQKLHANLADVSGEKNPMWGRNHSQETRRKIGDKTKERCKDPKYLERLSTSVTVEDRNNSSRRLSQRRKTELLEYYKEQESRTDLNTVWKDGRLYAVRNCEVCGNEMVLPWRIREQACCSRSCSNRMGSTTKARTKGQRAYFAEKSRQTLHNQVMVFKNLEGDLGRTPLKKEWEYRCRQEGVPVRFQKETPNPHILSGYQELKEVAAGYNHRVKSVKNVVGQEDVFNITVDDFHTVGVVFKNDNSSNISGIFTPQCGEQPLESHEMCNLVETFPAHHDTYEDYERTLKMAYLYAKTVTLVPTHVPRANAVMTRNRRIGCSMSGIIQAMVKLGRRSFLEWCDNGYDYIQKLDRIYSDWLGVPLSIKTTTVKPSGTTSLLCGATPGIHFPHSPFYIRHIRVADTSPLVDACREAGYQVEPDPYADNTFVVAFPVKEKHFVKGKREATIWEQFLNAADMQRYWANNAVSVTVTFNQQEVRDIRSCLETFEDRLKGVSMLPLSDDDHGYKFAPYVSITEDEYNQMVARISPINMSNSKHEVDDKFCSGDKCEIPLKR